MTRKLCLASFVLAIGLMCGCAVQSVILQDFAKVNNVEQRIGTVEEIEQYLKTSPNADNLRVWRLFHINSNKPKGVPDDIYAEGRLYGMHFVEIASNPALFDGNSQDGLKDQPEGVITSTKLK